MTDENKDDVLNDKDDEENLEGEATVVFDPDTMTLKLRYAHLDCWGTGETPIRSGLPQLTITGIGGAVLGRTNSITAENGDILFDDGDISLVRGTISAANHLTIPERQLDPNDRVGRYGGGHRRKRKDRH